MIWLWLSLLSAITSSIRDIKLKQRSMNISSIVICGALSFFTFVLLLPIAATFESLPSITEALPFAIASGAMLALGWLFYSKAMKLSDISLIAPLRPLSILYILLAGQVFLDEKFSLQGILGVCLVLIGAYVINTTSGNRDIIAPLRNLFSHKGQRLMLVATFCFGLCATFEKIGINLSSPLYFSCLENFIAALIIAVILVWQTNLRLEIFKEHWKQLFSLSLVNSLMFAVQSIAMLLAPAAYVVSIKSFNVVLTTAFGGQFFDEEHLFRRSIASAITISGIFLISLS